jgi:hypothetical protein
MRSFARLTLLLAAALLALVLPSAVAVGDKPAKPDKEKPNKPDKPDKGPQGEGKPEDKPGKPEKDKPNKGQDEQGGTGTTAPEDEQDPALKNVKQPETLPSAPPPQPSAPAHPEHTEVGETIAASVNAGTVRIKLPGSDTFVDLPADAPIPVGASVDATQGLVEIGSETVNGVEQNAVVTGAVFRVDQDPADKGMTDLTLQGGDFSDCDDTAVTARAAGKKRKGKGDVARGIWAAGKGKFRTRGRHGAATVRGTRWAVVDRCHSTTVKVFEGIVDVKDLLRGTTVQVRAGERYVASERRR